MSVTDNIHGIMRIFLKVGVKQEEPHQPFIREILDQNTSRLIPLIPVALSSDLFMASVRLPEGCHIVQPVLLNTATNSITAMDCKRHVSKMHRDSVVYMVWGDSLDTMPLEEGSRAILVTLSEEEEPLLAIGDDLSVDNSIQRQGVTIQGIQSGPYASEVEFITQHSRERYPYVKTATVMEGDVIVTKSCTQQLCTGVLSVVDVASIPVSTTACCAVTPYPWATWVQQSPEPTAITPLLQADSSADRPGGRGAGRGSGREDDVNAVYVNGEKMDGNVVLEEIIIFGGVFDDVADGTVIGLDNVSGRECRDDENACGDTDTTPTRGENVRGAVPGSGDNRGSNSGDVAASRVDTRPKPKWYAWRWEGILYAFTSCTGCRKPELETREGPLEQ